MITHVFGDGPHEFLLKIRQLEELQDHTKSGPISLYNRLFSRDWRVEDVYHTIRLGLIGGGMSKDKALKLVESTLDDLGLVEASTLALVILADSLKGKDDDPAGKADAPAAATETTIKSGSD